MGEDRIDWLAARLDRLETNLGGRIDCLQETLEERLRKVEGAQATMQGAIGALKWLFGTLVGIGGLVVAIIALGG
ncbi:MAG TPA: hypothetical protein VF226_04775 [Hyphomicrobiaceae bacterium]